MTLEENDPLADGEVIIVSGIPVRHFIFAGGDPDEGGLSRFYSPQLAAE